MKDLPVTDTYVHLWDPARFRYEWLDDNPDLNRAFMLADYLKATESINVQWMVFMQCDACPDVRFVQDHIASPDIKSGVLEPWASDIEELAKRENRVLYGGDWPVMTLAGRYEEWFSALEWALSGVNERDVRSLLHENATGVLLLPLCLLAAKEFRRGFFRPSAWFCSEGRLRLW